MKLKGYKEEMKVPDGTEVRIAGFIVTVKGPKGEIKKELRSTKVKIHLEGEKLMISTPVMTKKEKKQIYSFKAHLKNMIKGCQEKYNYKLKICSGHFPMNVTVNKEEFIVKNFLGEKIPRTIKIKRGAEVKVDGNIIIIESNDKELAGQVAADIENLTAIKKRDNRIFQDGIYIIEKDNKLIESN